VGGAGEFSTGGDKSLSTLIGVRFRDPEDFKSYVLRLESTDPGIPVLLATQVFEYPDGSVVALFRVSEDRSVVERILSVYRTLRPVEIFDKIPEGARLLVGPEKGVEEPFTLDFKAFLRLLSIIGYTSAAGLRDVQRQSPVESEVSESTAAGGSGGSGERAGRTLEVSETSERALEVSPQDVQAVKRWISEGYLEPFTGSARRILEDIVERLEIDPAGRRISLGAREARFRGLRDVRSAVASLLEDYRQTLGDSFEKAVDAVSSIVVETLSMVLRPSISVEVRNISLRERLAYELYRYVLEKAVVKTFRVGDTVIGVYCYDGGVYEECETELERTMWEAIRDREDLKPKTTRWVIKEAMNKVKLETLYDLRYEPLKIAFRNAVFDWEKFLETGSIRRSVEPFNPETVVFHRIPHRLALEKLESLEGLLRYSENLITNLEELAQRLCPRTLKAFRDWVGDKWILLFEVLGYTLYPRHDLHKAVMLLGDGSNGKSTYLRLVREVLGSHNVVSIPLQDLTNEKSRFTAAQLYRKLANIYADLPSAALKSTGVFKILTGEDPITADRKFREPITFINYAKLLFSANELPKVFDMTDAFWRRWIVIEFPNKFPEDPTFFERTFTEEEIEGAIIVSLYAFRNVWVRKRFSFEKTPEDYREKWMRMTNTVYAFIQDLLTGRIEGLVGIRDPEGRVETGELYNIYVDYCNREELEPVPKREFTQEMERLGFRRVKVKGSYYYKGLRIERAEKPDRK